MHCQGNRQIFELEALLQGSFSLPAAKYRKIFSKIVNYSWGEELRAHEIHRQEIKYDSVTRILPGVDMRRKFNQTINEIGKVSDEDTLTFLYIISHGEPGSFLIDNKQHYSYSSLLNKLNRIKGRKAIVALALNSASLLDVIEQNEQKENYIAIVSANSSESAVDWNEADLHELLVINILDREKLSSIYLPYSDGNHPTIKGYFDVVL